MIIVGVRLVVLACILGLALRGDDVDHLLGFAALICMWIEAHLWKGTAT